MGLEKLMNLKNRLSAMLFIIILYTVTGVLGCLDKDGLPQASESNTSNVILQRVTSSGGTVVYKDVKLDLNDSALLNDTMISIIEARESETESLVQSNKHVASETEKGRAYTVNPAGFVFNRPVIMTIPVRDSSNEFYPFFPYIKAVCGLSLLLK